MRTQLVTKTPVAAGRGQVSAQKGVSKQFSDALKRLRLRHPEGAKFTRAQLVAEVLEHRSAIKNTWLADEVDPDADADQLQSALASLLAGGPAVSHWADAIGETYRSPQVRQLLGVPTRQALDNRIGRRSLLVVKTADLHLLFPAWQFADHKVVAGLGAVLKALPEDVVDPWTLASWLRRPHPELAGKSVAEALRDGDRDGALRVARRAAARWSQ